MAPEIASSLLFFSPWGSLELGREVHTLGNYQIHQRFCHHYADISCIGPRHVCAKYLEPLRFDMHTLSP